MKCLSICLLLSLFCGFGTITEGSDLNWDLLIPCIIEAESGGNPNAVSKAGCIGLMQISGIVLEEWNNQKSPPSVICYEQNIHHIEPHFTKEALYYGEINVAIGTWYLKRLRNHYGCETIEQICGAYNWGIGNVRKVNYDYERFPKSVKRYIQKILKCYEQVSPK